MKKIFVLTFAVAFLVSLSACLDCDRFCKSCDRCCMMPCLCKKPVADADICAKNIANQVCDYKRSVESAPQSFESEDAKKIYSRLVAIHQQQGINTMTYKSIVKDLGMESLYQFDRSVNAFRLTTRKDGKVVSDFIYWNGHALESSDGVKFYVVKDQEKINTLAFIFDFRMNFAEYAKEVSTPMFESPDREGNVSKTAKDVLYKGKHCNVLNVKFVRNTYAANMKLYVDVVAPYKLSAMEINPVVGLPATHNALTIEFVSSEKDKNGFILGTGTVISTKDGKSFGVTLKDYSINAPMTDGTFKVAPENIIDEVPVVATPKKNASKKAPEQKKPADKKSADKK